MKKSIGRKRIAAAVALCAGAVWIATRQETGTPHDQASGEDRRAIRTTTLSEGRAEGLNYGSPAGNMPDTEPVYGTSNPQTGKQDPKTDKHQPEAPGTARDAKEEGKVAAGGVRDANPEAQTAQPEAASSPPGIQLAPEVRLPVAALPVDFVTNDVTERMLELIVADYYRDLAEQISQDEEETQSNRLTEENGETTILVRNGPAAEAARVRADWRFRTIFGKDAYNRLSMHSSLDARLPVPPPANGE